MYQTNIFSFLFFLLQCSKYSQINCFNLCLWQLILICVHTYFVTVQRTCSQSVPHTLSSGRQLVAPDPPPAPPSSLAHWSCCPTNERTLAEFIYHTSLVESEYESESEFKCTFPVLTYCVCLRTTTDCCWKGREGSARDGMVPQLSGLHWNFNLVAFNAASCCAAGTQLTVFDPQVDQDLIAF